MNKLKTTGIVLASMGVGFGIGNIHLSEPSADLLVQEIHPEISLIQFQKISGDLLQAEVFGPVRVLWAEDNMMEGDGVYEIPLSQIPNENDLKFTQFPYTGNAKTMKFYPSDTYFARGVESQYRRFFQTKEEAIQAGFIPSKSVE